MSVIRRKASVLVRSLSSRPKASLPISVSHSFKTHERFICILLHIIKVNYADRDSI